MVGMARWMPLELSLPRKIENPKQYCIPGGLLRLTAGIKDLKDVGVKIPTNPHSARLFGLFCGYQSASFSSQHHHHPVGSWIKWPWWQGWRLHMDFYSPRLPWLWPPLNARSASSRNQHWLPHMASIPWVISQPPGGRLTTVWKGQCFILTGIDAYIPHSTASDQGTQLTANEVHEWDHASEIHWSYRVLDQVGLWPCYCLWRLSLA